ncbi:unnamed protein product [Chilo suppressalis]|uniref:Pentatricopeptide repeat-containing protein-mitochondrial domain-containing protein n=1 Tax=Chilo suppressalis TaxID=168631 RepID=A0ABN8BCF0_CHISP|nr:unnamed protein product [Chilo suppressalis]
MHPNACHCRNIQLQRHLSVSTQRKYVESKASGKVSPNSTKENNTSLDVDKRYFSQNELLENLVAGLSSDIHQKNRVYKNDLMRVVNKIKEINFSTKKQSILLIQCCTELLPDESPASRMNLLDEILKAIKPHTEFKVEHYNELLRVYIANNRNVVASAFITQMAPVKPNTTTYELILRALAECGDLNQSTEVISNMKANNVPANEDVFNSLIICQAKAGNLNNIKEVLSVMKSLKINQSIDTYTAIVRALAWNKKSDLVLEEMKNVQKSSLQFEETHIMEIVKTLAVCGEYGIINQVLSFLPAETLNKPSISPYMQSVATYLVFQNHPMVALEIYKCLPLPSFGPKDDKGLHGRSLVRDCVKAAMPSSIIALVTQELMSSGRNPIAIQNAAEAALQLGKVPLALDMFTRIKQLGMPLRPHYFWPILIHNCKSNGEKGIMSTLSTMITMDVQIDYETILNYTLPYVSFTSPQNLMKKFLDAGLTVSTVLTPMMETLLSSGQVRAASEICELFQGKIDAEKLVKPLMNGYLMSSDIKSTVYILEDMSLKASDKNKDWVGRFLCVLIQNRKVKNNLVEFLHIIKAIKSTSLKISTSASDYCMSCLPEKYSGDHFDDIRNHLIEIIDDRLVDEGELLVQHVPHPKHMNEESLKAHLSELEAKGMNTRGVLRKLLQQYCRDGNLAAAREIAEKCQKEDVFLSAGMKAAIFDLHVKLGELDLAELALADLNKTAPNFNLDEFKVIDFATLMIYRKKFKQAIDLINEQSKKRRIVGGNSIAMNCWRLLDATATNCSHIETRQIFDLLVSLRYCRPTNAILGPLVRVHLKNDNIQEAVNEFVRLSTKYNKTPLKHELLCRILTAMGEGKSEDKFIANEKSNGRLNKFVQTILNVDKKVHGPGDVQLSLIAALADVGYSKTLRKMLLDPSVKFHPDALLRRCEKFADEKKIKPLEAIAECSKDLRHVDVDEVYNLILSVYQREDNVHGALNLWNRMQELDITPSQQFIRNICALFKANNRDIPSELSALLDKQDKVASQ